MPRKYVSDKASHQQFAAIKALGATRTLEDIIREEKEHLERQRNESLVRQRESGMKSEEAKRKFRLEKIKNESPEKRFWRFLSCFNTEWHQLAFQTLCFSGRGLKETELRREFKRLIGENHCPATLSPYIERCVDNGFAEMREIEGVKTYFPTQWGVDYALPATVRLMRWSLEHKISSYVYIGASNDKENSNKFANRHCNRAKTLIKLKEMLPKRPTNSKVARGIGINDRGTSDNNILLLRKYGLIEYDAVSKGEKIGRRIFVGKSVRGAKNDPEIKIRPVYLKAKLVDALVSATRKGRGLSPDELAAIVGYPWASTVSLYLKAFDRRGHTRNTQDRWIPGEKQSEMAITPVAISCVDMLLEIKDAYKDLKSFRGRELKDFNLANVAPRAAPLYFPVSPAHTRYEKKIGAVLEYLRKKGERNSNQIYRDTPVKEYGILLQGVRDGKLKVREARDRKGVYLGKLYSLA